MLRTYILSLLLSSLFYSMKPGCLGAEMTDIECNGLQCDPADICVCQGSSVTVPWQIPHPGDIFTVHWTLEDDSSSVTSILSQDNNEVVTVVNGFNIVYNGNGGITLTSVTPDNSGIYRCAVTYDINTHTRETGTVTISVNDPPTGLSYNKTGSRCMVTYNGYPAASLNAKINNELKEPDYSTLVGGKEAIECCLTGVAVRCMNDITAGCSSTQTCIPVSYGRRTGGGDATAENYIGVILFVCAKYFLHYAVMFC